MSFEAFPFNGGRVRYGSNWRRLLALGLILSVFLPVLGATVAAHPPADSPPDNDHFLLYQDENRDTICRKATALEGIQLDKINPKNLRPINHLIDFNNMQVFERVPNEQVQHLTIILRATQNLENNAPAKAAFIRAAQAWENLITSPVTIYIDADVGPDNFGTPWESGVLGATSSPSQTFSYSQVKSNLIAGANTPEKLAIYNALPVGTVPIDTGTGSATNVSVSHSIGRAIGLLDPTALSTDSAARIGFNSASNFDYDSSDGVVGTDFQSVATHEIGHALGFSSRSGFTTPTSTPAVWDLYRFRTGTTTATFSTALRIMTAGGPTTNSQYYFAPGQIEVGLSDGGPNSVTTNNADGNQSSHWRQASLNGGVFSGYIGIMDPRLPGNITRAITANDTNALHVFGYNSDIVGPAPPPTNDNFASAQVITGCSGSVNGSNLSATRETGEPNHSPDDGGGARSIWYKWQAPGSGSVTFTTAGSGFDTVMGIYTGSSVSSLTTIGKHDDVSSTDKTSLITFNANVGTTYMVAVDGYNNFGSGGDFGPVTLNWNLSNCTQVPLQLMLEESGSIVGAAVAIDSILFLRDPFAVVNSSNLFNQGGDPNTRLIVFLANLQLAQGEPASAVIVNLIDSTNQTFDISAQDVQTVPNQTFTQVTFRLPDGLSVGTCQIKVSVHSQVSNTATFRIKS